MRAVDVCPFDPVTLVNYGKICLEKNKVKEAEDVFEEAVKLQPDMLAVVLLLDIVFDVSGSEAKAGGGDQRARECHREKIECKTVRGWKYAEE
eukprot:762926-Hanusia_phi.AAC.1